MKKLSRVLLWSALVAVPIVALSQAFPAQVGNRISQVISYVTAPIFRTGFVFGTGATAATVTSDQGMLITMDNTVNSTDSVLTLKPTRTMNGAGSLIRMKDKDDNIHGYMDQTGAFGTDSYFSAVNYYGYAGSSVSLGGAYAAHSAEDGAVKIFDASATTVDRDYVALFYPDFKATKVAGISGIGDLRPNISGAAASACDANHRNAIHAVQGGAGVADHVDMCMKGTADTYSWVVVKTAP